MHSGIVTRVLSGICALSIAVGLAGPASAQSAPSIRSVTSYTVKTDRVGDFTGAVKEYNAVLKKAGWDKRYTIWTSSTGPVQYRLVSYSSKWAEFDTPRGEDPKLKDVSAELTGIGRRIMACVERYERTIEEINPAISLPRASEPPKMISSVRVRVRPDRAEDYVALLKSDLFPGIQKSSIKTFSVARARYGASRYEFRLSLGLDKWADLDEMAPVIKAVGQDKYDAYVKKMRPMVTYAEYNIYRLAKDLSYLP